MVRCMFSRVLIFAGTPAPRHEFSPYKFRLRLRLINLNRMQKKYNYLSELRSCEKRVEEGGREETAGGRWGGGERAEGG